MVEKASDQTFRCHLGLERPSTEVRQKSTRNWIAHQRTQLEAGTFDSRTLTTTIRERSWAMIIDLKPQDMNTFFKALEEVYALDSRGRFLDAPYPHARPA